MNKCKIVIILPSLLYGGAETMSTQLATAINKEKFDVYFIITHSIVKSRVYDILMSDSNIHLLSLNEDNGICFRAIRKMNKLLKKIKPNIIHTHMHTYVYAAIYSFFHRVKILHTMHNIPEYESNKQGKFILRILFKLKIAIPIGISDTVTEKINKFYKIKNTITIFNPVNTNKFLPVKKEKNNVFTFLTVGRMSEQKNQFLLLSSFKKMLELKQNIKLIVAGSGHLKEQTLEFAHQNNLDSYVEFVGDVSNVKTYYQSADVFVLSSNYEGLPMSILEAMSCRLPIISTDVGGVKDIVTNNGILVPANDENALVNAMVYLMDNPNEREKFADNSLENSKRFDLYEITKKYEDAYIKYAKGIK